MSGPAPVTGTELAAGLSSGAISLEEFLWAAPAAGLDRRAAALRAVAAAATSSPGGRTVNGPTPPAASPVASRVSPAGDILRVGLWLPVDGMDPAIATYRTSRLVTEQLYSTLMALGPDGRPHPDLAAWVEVSPDARTYTFGLVDGVRFHDGSPLTADDVAFTFRRLLDMGTAYHFDPWVATIAGVDVVDPSTVRISLTQPTGPLLTWLAFCGTGIVRRADVEAGRDLMTSPNGSGPFRLAEPWPGGTAPIRLVRHDASVRGGARFASRLAAIEFQCIPSDSERAAALLAGRIDLDALLAPDAFADVAATPGLVAHRTPDSRWHWLVVNCRQSPLGDVRVRRAIASAIDRRALLAEGFRGLGTPITAGVVAPWSFAAAPDIAGFAEEAEPAAARALLAAAGVGPDTQLTITASSALPIAMQQAELIAAQLSAAGLATTVDVVDPATSAARVSRDGDFQLATSYWGSPIFDPDDFVWMGFRSGARYDAGSCSSAALDEQMELGRGSVLQAVRRAAYRRLQELAVDQLPVVPTIQPAMLRGASGRLRGFVPTPCAQLRTLRDAWLADGSTIDRPGNAG